MINSQKQGIIVFLSQKICCYRESWCIGKLLQRGFVKSEVMEVRNGRSLIVPFSKQK